MIIGDMELQRIKNMMEKQEEQFSIDESDYNKGMRNAIEMVLSFLETRTPDYYE